MLHTYYYLHKKNIIHFIPLHIWYITLPLSTATKQSLKLFKRIGYHKTVCNYCTFCKYFCFSLIQMRQCPFCRFRHTDIERLRSHVMNQHAVQPAVRCPLCQDTLHSIALLRTHLTHLHSVTVDCTQKLINTVRRKKETQYACTM